MKRGTLQHPKFRRLQRLLDVDDAKCAGTLEMLWLMAVEFHDDGGIGRFSDDELAVAVAWSGEPRQLVLALEESRWIDRVADDAQVRLVIHDWLCHAPSHVWDRVRKRKNLTDGTAPSWLVAMVEKAKVERNRDQSRRDGDEYEGRNQPSSGRLRQPPAPSDPNPRPKTQDLNSSNPRLNEGTGGGAAASPALVFVCSGKDAQEWGLLPEHLASLESRWGDRVAVLPCLKDLADRQRFDESLRRSQSAMPGYVETWLNLDLERFKKFPKHIPSGPRLPPPTVEKKGAYSATRERLKARRAS